MVDHDHDEALHRLRADDPATGSDPDLHRLRALLSHKAPASQGADAATRVDDDLLRGPRLRAPWIAAAAVAAVGLTGGGYALGLQQAPEPAPAATGGPALNLDPASPGLDLAGEAMGGDAGVGVHTSGAMGTSGAMAVSSSDGGASWDIGTVRLSAGEGLPEGPGTGEVRALVSDRDPDELLGTLAAHLGMEDATPLPDGLEEYGISQSSLADPERGLVLFAGADTGPLSFSFQSTYADPYCAQMYEGMPEEDLAIVKEEWENTYGDEMPFPTPDLCRTAEGPLPDDATAKQVAAEFFEAAGIDLDGYEVQTYEMSMSDDGDDPYRSVDYMHKTVTDGSLYLSAVVGPEGLVSANGMVGEFTSLGQYPVISATEAVARYATREFSSDYGVQLSEDMGFFEDGASATSIPQEWAEPEPLPQMQAGDKIPVYRKDKVVTGAELVQGSMWVQNGGSIEVPVWKLTTGDGNSYPVLALADEAFDFRSWD